MKAYRGSEESNDDQSTNRGVGLDIAFDHKHVCGCNN